MDLAEFALVSLFCGFTSHIWVLILLRVLQGIGGAIIITNALPIIVHAFNKRKLGAVLNFNGFLVTFAQLIGPVLGGMLAGAAGWRWVFWINVPLGIFAFIIGLIVLKPVQGVARADHIDLWGNITLFFSLGGLILMLSEIGVDGWTSPLMLFGFILFLTFLALFIRVEHRAEFPILDFKLFRSQPYTMANLAAFFNSLARSSIMLLIILFFQLVDHENPLVSGLKVLPLSFGLVLSGPFAGYLMRYFSRKFLSTGGLFLTCLGMILLIFHIGHHASVFLDQSCSAVRRHGNSDLPAA